MQTLVIKGRLGKYMVRIWPHGLVEITDPEGLIYIARANMASATAELAEKEQAIIAKSVNNQIRALGIS